MFPLIKIIFCYFQMESPLYISKSSWINMSFKATVSLLIFCLYDQSIDVNRVLLLLYYCQFLPVYCLIFGLYTQVLLYQGIYVSKYYVLFFSDTFIIMLCPSLCFVIDFVLNLLCLILVLLIQISFCLHLHAI